MRSQDALLRRDREREGREQDKRFNVSRDLPTISAVEGEKLIQELTDFEQKISELGVVSACQLFRIFDLSLKGPARAWMEFERTRILR